MNIGFSLCYGHTFEMVMNGKAVIFILQRQILGNFPTIWGKIPRVTGNMKISGFFFSLNP